MNKDLRKIYESVWIEDTNIFNKILEVIIVALMSTLLEK